MFQRLCVICGEPRSGANSESKKFKICSLCYREIRLGHRPLKPKYQKNCEICGIHLGTVRSVPACMRCRTKWYRMRKIKKQLDDMIRKNDFSNIHTHPDIIREAGYEIFIKKKEVI